MRAVAIDLRRDWPMLLNSALANAFGIVEAKPYPIYIDDMAPLATTGGRDPEDVAASRRGDGDAFGRLVARHQNDIASLMSRFTPDHGRLEELVQDVFVEAWRSLPRFTEGRPLGPWLRTVAVHVGYRYWRSLKRQSKQVPLDEIAEIASTQQPPAPERAEELLHALLEALPPRDRLVLTLMYVEGHSIRETAELTGWSRLMVKVQAHRARGKLRKLVAKALSEEATT
jgi:RNA polymerase sigma-70 factor (ECF subfamily)